MLSRDRGKWKLQYEPCTWRISLTFPLSDSSQAKQRGDCEASPNQTKWCCVVAILVIFWLPQTGTVFLTEGVIRGRSTAQQKSELILTKTQKFHYLWAYNYFHETSVLMPWGICTYKLQRKVITEVKVNVSVCRL